MKVVKFIDLFAGIGGFKLGLMQGFKEIDFDTECVLTSEIKKHAIEILKLNFPNENHVGDIQKNMLQHLQQ
jgi:DNA (cytosine-5)-methyltransferase 1